MTMFNAGWSICIGCMKRAIPLEECALVLDVKINFWVEYISYYS